MIGYWFNIVIIDLCDDVRFFVYLSLCKIRRVLFACICKTSYVLTSNIELSVVLANHRFNPFNSF